MIQNQIGITSEFSSVSEMIQYLSIFWLISNWFQKCFWIGSKKNCVWYLYLSNEKQITLLFVSECLFLGQFVRHPTNDCKYKVCTYGNEPWLVANEVIQLILTDMKCPNGVSVNVSAFSQQHADKKPITPCVIFDNKCLGKSCHAVMFTVFHYVFLDMLFIYQCNVC